MMMGHLARAMIAAALLLAWSLPLARLAVLPQERAEALAADAICRAQGSGFQAPAFKAGSVAVALDSVSNGPVLSDLGQLFKPAMTRQWQADLARALLVIAGAALLLAGWRFAPPLVIVAAILYLLTYGVQWDGYRLLLVTESPRLWWNAISQWSPSLWSERLAAPLAIWLSLLGACWLLLRGATASRRSALAAP
jgi:hypothetical protein